MEADIQIIVGNTDWFSCQVCDSVTLSFFDTQSSPFMPKFHRIVFHSDGFECHLCERGAELVLELVPRRWRG